MITRTAPTGARLWLLVAAPLIVQFGVAGLGAAILGEPTHAIQIAGAALVLAGVLLVTRRPRPPPADA